eukprot:TRINITY_DN7327_c0_g1_i2.p1 TRINITY_DN7327_c0_g1~~TRINITY_DN7327_c0_g1_i2.p1  ORF type:complete len:551 (+),score=125.25 TRINITY_DN7327_c0_g1_i2:204-1856(+)
MALRVSRMSSVRLLRWKQAIAAALQPARAIAVTARSSADDGTKTFDEYHYNGMPITPARVERGLQLETAERCPFLNEVKSNLRENPEAQQAIAKGGKGGKTALREFIAGCMSGVLDRLKEEGRYREFRYLKRSVGSHPEVHWQLDSKSDVTIPVVNWCSNDYLNMAHHPVVLEAMQATLADQGAGAGGTRNIAGSNVLHIELERELAGLCSTEASLLFQSCYTANLGVMEALASTLGPDTIIFSDAENHASLVQGIRNTRLAKHVYRHNDLEHLEELLSNAPKDANKVVVFESVYSMSGTLAPVSAILDLCDKYGCLSVLDEVHAVGLYGSEGGGILDQIGQRGRATAVTGTLGKAFGVSGGFVAADHDLIDVIRSTSPSFIFTTSMPPVNAAGALASVRHVRDNEEARQQMQSITAELKWNMLELGIPLMSAETHIMPVFVGDGAKCKAMADQLLQQGIYVQPINYPSVPKGEELLRFTASPFHNQQHCEHLLTALYDLCLEHGLLQSPRLLDDAQSEHACICSKKCTTCDIVECPVMEPARSVIRQQV